MKKLQESLLDNEEELLDNTDLYKNVKYLKQYRSKYYSSKRPDPGYDNYNRELKIGDLVFTKTFTVGVIYKFSKDKSQCYIAVNEMYLERKMGFIENCFNCIKIQDPKIFEKLID